MAEIQVGISQLEHPAGHLLSLPYEIRHAILKDVLHVRNHLSSKQQTVALPSPQVRQQVQPGVANTALSSPSSSPMTKTNPKPQPRKWQSKVRATLFDKPASYFRLYAESRRADAAVLFVCRQLRIEGMPLWLRWPYALTLILENPMLTIPTYPASESEGQHEGSIADSDQLQYISLAVHESGHQKQQPTLVFDEQDQRAFWTRISESLRFPSFEVMNSFKRFHVAMFVQENAFLNVSKETGVSTGAMSRREICEILMGSTARSLHNSRNTIALMSGKQGCQPIDNKDRNFGHQRGATHTNEAVFQEGRERCWWENIKFLDHTYLGLCSDAENETEAVTSMQTSNGVELDNAKIVFSLEVWKI